MPESYTQRAEPVSRQEFARLAMQALCTDECFCRSHLKKIFSPLCRQCYFRLPDYLCERMFPYMAAALMKRANPEIPALPVEMWQRYPLLLQNCLAWLRNNTDRMDAR